MGMSSSGVKSDALANYGTNSSTAAGALSTINPIYSQMAQGNMGLTPRQKSDALTASSGSLGGGVAGAVGEGGLLAARTGNAGGATAALDDAARTAGVTQSQNALGVQNQSDAIARQNQQTGLSGLNSIYSGSNQQADASLNTANNVPQSFWQKLALQGVQSAGQVGAAFAGA
jgi:hypothetical protein